MNYTAPTYVPIEITSNCNLHCRHCYGKFPRKTQREMSYEQIKQIILDMYSSGVFRFEIGGGEPSIRKDFVDILEIFGDFKGVAVTVVTNGILYTDEMIERIAKIPNNICFHISVDGYDKETYSFLRGNKDVFPKVMETTLKMIKKGIDVRWNFAVGKKTVDYLQATIGLAEKMGIKSIRLMLLYNTGRATEEELGFNFQEFQEFMLNFLQDKYASNNVNVSMALTQPFEYLIPLLEKGIDINVIKEKILYRSCMDDSIFRNMTNTSCMAGRTLAAVDSEGNMHYCCMMSGEIETIGGNLLEKDFLDIWNNSPEFKWIRGIRLENLHTNCYNCKYKDICGGGCRARAYYATGDILGPDPLCPIVSYERKENNISEESDEDYFVPTVFSIMLGNVICRVRQETYGASVYTTNDKYFNLDQNAYRLLKLLKKFASVQRVIEALKGKNSEINVNIIEENYAELIHMLVS